MFFVLVPLLERAPRIFIHLARNTEKEGGVLMVPVPDPVPDSGFQIFRFSIQPKQPGTKPCHKLTRRGLRVKSRPFTHSDHSVSIPPDMASMVLLLVSLVYSAGIKFTNDVYGGEVSTLFTYSYFKKRCQKKSKKPISQDCKVIWEFLKLAHNADTT